MEKLKNTLYEMLSEKEQASSSQGLFSAIEKSSSDEFLFKLHFFIKDLLDAGDFDRLKKLFRIFDHSHTEPDILKTILVVTKSFAVHPELKVPRAQLYRTLIAHTFSSNPATETP